MRGPCNLSNVIRWYMSCWSAAYYLSFSCSQTLVVLQETATLTEKGLSYFLNTFFMTRSHKEGHNVKVTLHYILWHSQRVIGFVWWFPIVLDFINYFMRILNKETSKLKYKISCLLFTTTLFYFELRMINDSLLYTDKTCNRIVFSMSQNLICFNYLWFQISCLKNHD